MCVIVSEFAIGKYKVLELDGEKPKSKYTKYVIDGKAYDIVPIYDIPNCIAIESSKNFTGKVVTFK